MCVCVCVDNIHANVLLLGLLLRMYVCMYLQILELVAYSHTHPWGTILYGIVQDEGITLAPHYMCGLKTVYVFTCAPTSCLECYVARCDTMCT